MKDLDFFKNEASNRNLCSQYVDLWSQAKSKQDLFNLAMRYNSIRYIALSMYEGWGVGVDFLLSEFKEFINGVGHSEQSIGQHTLRGIMLVNKRGYSRGLKADIFNIISCRGITLKCENFATQYHINNDSSVSIILPERCNISVYLYDISHLHINIKHHAQKVVIYDYRDENAPKIEIDGAIIKKRELCLDAFGGIQHKKVNN